MIYLKWLLLCLIDWALLLTIPFVPPIIAIFTRAESHDKPSYSWGWLWGTYDNPPQGDEGFVAKRCLFPNVTTGFKGYLNRVHWLVRNPLYGYAKKCSLPYNKNGALTFVGTENISDKEGIPGWYFAKYKEDGKLKSFEFYGVFPYSKTRDLRVRLGWKLMTSKFEEYGFAQLVNSINPFDGYNND